MRSGRSVRSGLYALTLTYERSQMPEDILDEDLDGSKLKQKSIVDHLQAPRRKKKNYVTLALGNDIDSGLKQRIEYYIKLNHSNLSVIYVSDVKELAKMYTRQISLLIVSDSFVELGQKIEIIKRFKEKNRKSGMPVLFFTQDPDALTAVYNKKLMAYQEVDDFVVWDRKSDQHIFALIGSMLSQNHRFRRSRRFPVPFRVKYFDLRSSETYEGVLLDLSMHGALLQKHKLSPLLKDRDQLRVSIKLEGLSDLSHGESIHLSARVQRTAIGGEKAGISWEYMSEDKSTILLKLMTSVANGYMEKQSWAKKAEATYKRQNK